MTNTTTQTPGQLHTCEVTKLGCKLRGVVGTGNWATKGNPGQLHTCEVTKLGCKLRAVVGTDNWATKVLVMLAHVGVL
jgi:hypothetical protein